MHCLQTSDLRVFYISVFVLFVNEIEEAFAHDKPYFGLAALGISSPPHRYAVLRSLVKRLAESKNNQAIRILEIGSWIGASTLTLARSIGELRGGLGSLTCVDTWQPYLDKEVNNRPSHQIMDLASKLDLS